MTQNDVLSQLKIFLKEIFHFETSSLDFGNYKIYNLNHAIIKNYIDSELEEFVNNQLLTKFDQLHKAENNFFLNDENLIICRNQIYRFLLEFFSKYFIKNDSGVKRQLIRNNTNSSQNSGKDINFSWLNQFEFYIEPDEHFPFYIFKTNNRIVTFSLIEGDFNKEHELEKKYNTKYILFNDLSVSNQNIDITFTHRAIEEEEMKVFVETTGKDSVTIDTISSYNVSKIYDELVYTHVIDKGKGDKKSIDENLNMNEIVSHLKRFSTKNIEEIFIHKDLENFFGHEIGYYVNSVLSALDETISDSNYFFQIQIVKIFKAIAQKLIDFLVQIEEIQKILFEKKKFVLSTNYCITLDLIDEKFYPEILLNKEQLQEWLSLFNFSLENELKTATNNLLSHVLQNQQLNAEILKKNSKLLLDTKFFSNSFKYRLLSSIQSLDEQTTGILIKSDNFQALNLLENKYKERINSIYIDPPYNTDKNKVSRKFLYNDGFSHSSWITMLYDPIKLGYQFLDPKGLLFASIGDDEDAHLKIILDSIFGENCFVSNSVVQSASFVETTDTIKMHEYVLCYKKAVNENLFGKIKITEGRGTVGKEEQTMPVIEFPKGIDVLEVPDGVYTDTKKLDSKEDIYLISDKIVVKDGKLAEPVKLKARWRNPSDLKAFFNNDCQPIINKFKKKIVRVYIKGLRFMPYSVKESGEKLASLITVNIVPNVNAKGGEILKNMFGEKKFDFPKSPPLLKYLFSFVDHNALVLDFFAGSGTTGEAILSMNNEDEGKRKFILIEKGNYFESILKPRILKAIYSDEWKNGYPDKSSASKKQIIKYFSLEQYEDTLANIEYGLIDHNTQIKDNLQAISYELNGQDFNKTIQLKLPLINDPFNYTLNVVHSDYKQKTTVDLIETLNYFLGIQVNSIKLFLHQNRDYVCVDGLTKEGSIIVIWRSLFPSLDLTREKSFIETTVVTENYTQIFINGNSLVKNALSIEKILYNNLFQKPGLSFVT